ncbi:hypothetical protein ACQQ93_12505 [Lachnospiraceae bacterium SGI.256]
MSKMKIKRTIIVMVIVCILGGAGVTKSYNTMQQKNNLKKQEKTMTISTLQNGDTDENQIQQ